jgi:hypothetical protein
MKAVTLLHTACHDEPTLTQTTAPSDWIKTTQQEHNNNTTLSGIYSRWGNIEAHSLTFCPSCRPAQVCVQM